jgi:tyrosyl-tRNA synthetase
MATDPDAAAGEAARLARNAVDSLPSGELEQKLRLASRDGRQLRVKLGIDPTAPDIHLGHAVVLGKLREFQDAGHRVVLIIGDYTARVGDPSGRSTLRPILSDEQIDANAATFQSQALRVLDPDPSRLEVRSNGEWLDMPMADLLRLVRTTTVAQLLEREDFASRWQAQQPISVLELLYPLLQGYDSVAIDADVELGGTDQKFNLLLGRDIQHAYGRPQQAIMTMPILVGTDGTRKMSKTLGNQIGVTDEPGEMFGKAMSIPDEAMDAYYRLLVAPRHADGGGDPHVAALSGSSARDAKRRLAHELVAWLHSEQAAQQAEAEFERVFAQKELPSEIEEATIPAGGEVHLPALIAEQFSVSRSEARRLLEQGGAWIGERQLGAGDQDLPAGELDGEVLRVGKRRFRRLRAV